MVAGIVGLLAYVVKISMDYARVKHTNTNLEGTVNVMKKDLDTLTIDYSQLKTKFEQNEKRDEEERENNEKRFNELYNSRNQTNEQLIKLTTTVEILVSSMNDQFKSINGKLDNAVEQISKRGLKDN